MQVCTTIAPEHPDDARARCAVELVEAVLPAGGLAIVRGLPGAGVSRMLRSVAGEAAARGARVGRVVFDRPERDFPFAALERMQLTLPQLQGAALPEPTTAAPHELAAAFTAALLAGDDTARDVLVFDDLAFADEASGLVLRYALPRFVARGAAVVVGVSLAEPSELAAQLTEHAAQHPQGRILTLPELSAADISMLVRGRSGVGVPRRIAERIRRITGGRFAAVVAYLDSLDEAAVADLSAVRVLPFETHARMRPHRRLDLAGCTPPTRLAAKMCAVTRDAVAYEDFRRVAAELGIPPSGRTAADGDTVVLSTLTGALHLADPLAAPDVLAQAGSAAIQVIHRVLADTTHGLASHLHRLEAADGIDAALAEWVLDVARTYETRGRGDDAVELLEVASRLARGGDEYLRLLLAFGLTCVRQLAGVEHQGRMVEFDEAADLDPRAGYVYAWLRTYKAHGRTEAQRLRLDFIAAPALDGDHEFLQADIALLEFFSALQTGGDAIAPAAELAGARLAALDGRVPDDPQLAWLDGTARLAYFEGVLDAVQSPADPLGAVERILARTRSLPETATERADLLVFAAVVLAAIGAVDALAPVLAELDALEPGLTRPLLLSGQLVTVRAETALRTGDWDAARAILASGMERVDDSVDMPARVVMPAMCAWLAVMSGDRVTARRYLDMAEGADRYRYHGHGRHWLPLAQAEYALQAGDAGAALERLESMGEHPDPTLTAMRIRLLEECGRVDEAATLLESTRERLAMAIPGTLELLAARLALASGDAAGALEATTAGLALAAHPLLVGELEQVASLAHERMRGSLDAALAAAARAEAAFASLGAQGAVERVRATTDAAVSAHAARIDSLSGRERQVANLAAEGWTNKEIARELRIGAATVAFHVSNVLAKLELTGRGQIAAALRRR